MNCWKKKCLIYLFGLSILSQIIGASAHNLKATSSGNLRLAIPVEFDATKKITCPLQFDRKYPIMMDKLQGFPNLVFSPDSKTLAITDYSGGHGLILVDLLSGNHENILPRGWLGAVSFSPDGKFIALGSAGPSVFLVNREKKTWIKLKGHSRKITDVQFSPDSQLIGTVGLDNTAMVWHVDGTSRVKIKGLPKSQFGTASDRDPQISRLSWNTRGQMLTVASGSGGSQIIVWDSQNDRLTRVSKQSQLAHVQFTPDDRIIAVSSGVVSLFDMTGEEVSTWPRQANISHLDLSSNGRFFVTTTSSGERTDRQASLWGIDSSLLATLQGHEKDVVKVVISNDSQCILTSSFDQTIRLWDVSGKELSRIPGEFPIALSPDNSHLAIVDEDKTVIIWKLNKISNRQK